MPQIRPAKESDLPAILSITNREIREGIAHFGIEELTLDQALADFDRAQDLRTGDADPNTLEALYGSAATFALTGPYQPALECLERAIAGDAKYRSMADQEEDFGRLRDNPQFGPQFARLLRGT